MKYEILDVERRNVLARFLDIHEYKVTVKLGNGQILKFNAWAGCRDPTLTRLLWDIKWYIEKYLILPKWKVVLKAIGKKGDV